MRKNEIIYDGPVTGTYGEEVVLKKGGKVGDLKEEFGAEFQPLQQDYRVNPADEADYKGSIGFKDS